MNRTDWSMSTVTGGHYIVYVYHLKGLSVTDNAIADRATLSTTISNS